MAIESMERLPDQVNVVNEDGNVIVDPGLMQEGAQRASDHPLDTEIRDENGEVCFSEHEVLNYIESLIPLFRERGVLTNEQIDHLLRGPEFRDLPIGVSHEEVKRAIVDSLNREREENRGFDNPYARPRG